MTTAAVNRSQSEQIYQSLNAPREKSFSVANEAENRFLSLLTTQLKNQDPLNPLDNAQLTSQLAQISTVNGIERLNASLQRLLSGLEDTQTMEAAALVNRGVLVPGSSLVLGEQGAIGGLELATAADAATVTIRDANGLVMRTLTLGALPAGIHPFVWDGKTDNGQMAANGNYSTSVDVRRGNVTTTESPLTYGVVQAVTRGASGMALEVGTLGAFGTRDIRQIL